MEHRREIDGLRAIAVVPVILFHAGFSAFSGGFVGVDIFFVISGFLICGILADDLDGGRFSLGRFYERRARRILPALFFLIAMTIPAAVLMLDPEALQAFARSVAANVLFVSNLLFWREDNYFAPAAALKPLLHTWSLAVEEQFYLLFPLLLAGLWKLGRRWVWDGIAAAFVASFALSLWADPNAPVANFFLAPTRAWELAAGALAALWWRWHRPAPNTLLAAVGLVTLAVAIFAIDESFAVPELAALLPVGGTVAVLLFAQEGTGVARLLGARLLVGIGLISYSAYLWHQPLLAFARVASGNMPDPVVMAVLAAASLVLGWVSWRFVERPFRRRERNALPTRRSVFVASAIAAAGLLSASIALMAGRGPLERWWIGRQSAEVVQAYRLGVSVRGSEANWGMGGASTGELSRCRFNVDHLDGQVEARLAECAEHFGPGVLLVGDSHAVDTFGMLASRFDRPFLVGLTRPYCRPAEVYPGCYFDALEDLVRRRPELVEQIFYEQAGIPLLIGPTSEPHSRAMFSQLRFGEAAKDIAVDRDRVDQTAQYLLRLSKFVPVTWLGPKQEPLIDEVAILRFGCAYPYPERPGQRAIYRSLEAAMAKAVAGQPRLRFVSLIDAMKVRMPEDFLNCRDRYWADPDHLSAAGEARFGRRLPGDFLDAGWARSDFAGDDLRHGGRQHP